MTAVPNRNAGDDGAQRVLVWWTSERDCRLLSSIYAAEDDRREDNSPAGWPDYLTDEYRGRYGRNGRGRLWVAPQFGDVAIEPWPETPFAAELGEWFAGIVIRADDLWLISYLPGVVTDLALNVCTK